MAKSREEGNAPLILDKLVRIYGQHRTDNDAVDLLQRNYRVDWADMGTVQFAREQLMKMGIVEANYHYGIWCLTDFGLSVLHFIEIGREFKDAVEEAKGHWDG